MYLHSGDGDVAHFDRRVLGLHNEVRGETDEEQQYEYHENSDESQAATSLPGSSLLQ